ncbi:MAG: TIGR04282 family arsenosugar biosynthesis glycosyltransferase [Dehalococcoidia bacterium]
MPLGYGPGGGSARLRAAIARLYPSLSSENVLVTAGAAEAIRIAAMALVPAGSRVVVQTPSYAALEQSVRDEGAQVVPLRPAADGNFHLQTADAAEIAFLNSPYGFGGSQVQGLEAFDGRLIVDEVYRPIELVPGTAARSVIEISKSAVAIGDLSKPLGLGGLRVGWIVSRDSEAIARSSRELDYLSGSISVVSAELAVAALENFDTLLAGHAARARRNLSRWASLAATLEPWIEWKPPQSGFNIDVRLRNGDLPAEAYERLRAKGVFLLPGEALGWPGHLRIGLGGAEEDFTHAIGLLASEISRGAGHDVHRQTGSVIVISKAPRPGFGKSRLASQIGEIPAFALASAFLNDTLDFARERAGRLFVAIEPPESAPELRSAMPGADVFAQRSGGLGERLLGAFADAFARGAVNPVLIGSDSPTLPPELLSLAHRALESYDVVLGPAEDGGYYLVGLHAPVRSLFDGIDWSTAAVLTQTLKRCREAGLSVFCLPYWYDVDSLDGLKRLAEDPLVGPETATALRGVFP